MLLRPPLVYFVAPLPPPVHGQAISSLNILNLLLVNGFSVTRLDSSTPPGASPSKRALSKIASTRKALFALMTGDTGPAYLSVNANRGMWMTVLLATAARMRNRRVLLHHHTNTHIDSFRVPMWLLSKVSGASHIVICDSMLRALRDRYEAVGIAISFGNIGAVVDMTKGESVKLRTGRSAPYALGHMSNLTEEKGIGRVIDSFRKCRELGLAKKLVVAGPATDHFSRATIDAAKKEFGKNFEYLGAVDGASKQRFFDSIDVFLFPSLYKNETQGIVNLEALAAGVCVCAFALCCIRSDLDDASCKAVDVDDDFTNSLVDFLRKVNESGGNAFLQARRRYEALLAEHEAEKNIFLELFKSQQRG